MAPGDCDEEAAREASEAAQGDAPEPMECEDAGEQEEDIVDTEEARGSGAQDDAPEQLQEYEEGREEGGQDAGEAGLDDRTKEPQERGEAGYDGDAEEELCMDEDEYSSHLPFLPSSESESDKSRSKIALIGEESQSQRVHPGAKSASDYAGQSRKRPAAESSKPPKKKTTAKRLKQVHSHNTESDVIPSPEEVPTPLLPSSPVTAPDLSKVLEDTTTVDPCHIISLIRKLIPQDYNVEKELSVKEGFPEERIASSNDGESIQHEIKDPWEASGCVLWDLSACEPQAEVMMNNLVLEVLLENLRVTQSPRVKEICLGIMGNLACHASLANSIISKDGLITAVVDQLFVDDAPCLTETFRLLSTILRSNTFIDWVEDLLPDEIISRIIWIIGNTMNSALIKAIINFLSTAIDDRNATIMLIEPLIKQGLVDHIISWLAIEMEKLLDESKLDRPASLGFILNLFEELCSIKSCSEVMLSSDQLIKVLYNMIKLPDKFEVANYCTSVVIILDNLLADGKHLSPMVVSHDLPLLEGLFDILPLVSDAHEVRSALWSILARFLAQAQKVEMNSSSLDQFVSLLLQKFTLIKNDLEDHGLDKEENLSAEDDDLKHGISTSLRVICIIMERWIAESSSQGTEETRLTGNSIEDARKLLSYCRKFDL